MNDVKAIRHLLANNAALLSVVPAALIVSGVIPLDSVLPAVCVNHISSFERNTVAMSESAAMATARVQVTVQAKTYAEQKSVLDLVRRALPNTRGIVNGVDVDSILPDVEGPDLRDDIAEIFMQSRDFIVKFLEQR